MSGESWLMAVDGTGLLVRCSRGAAQTGLCAPDGTETGALTLFAGSLSSMVRQVQPTHMLVAWDGVRGRAWRREACPEYKRNRPAFPDRRPAEGEQVSEFCEAAGIAQWCLDDFEADDLLAAAVRLARRDLPGVQVALASDDQDVFQLAQNGVLVRGLGRDGVLTDAETVELLYGVRPALLPALRALEGDRSDGIPGLPGIGRAKALRMLTAAGMRWPLPPEVLPPSAERDQVGDCFGIMDLSNPVMIPEAHDETGILDIAKTAWKRGNILPVLEKYGMRKMAERWSAGHFW